MKAVLSLSGGLDSTSLLIHLISLNYEIKTYSFDYGQKHSLELERVKKNIDYLQKENFKVSHQVINLRDVFSESKSALTSDTAVPEGHYAEDNMKKTVVENRNAIFSAIIYGKALAWSKGDRVDICLGIHSGDHHIYKDCRPEFRDAINLAFRLGNDNSENIDFYTPYLKGNKETILKDLIKNCDRLIIDVKEILRNTNTCYNPNDKGQACGKCGSCVERVEAFINLKCIDPVDYQSSWEDVIENVKKTLKLSH